MRDKDTFRGCLIGGAVGDALGYTVEFLSEHAIFQRYGSRGIVGYKLNHGVAQISDDTQMTMFTVTGLLEADTVQATKGINVNQAYYVSKHYKDWYKTQTQCFPVDSHDKSSWLVNVPELFSQRAPGNTCLSAIKQGANGTIDNPINNSKGCGGIMRVAPVGLYLSGRGLSKEKISRVGADVAALTHSHELGYLPASVLTSIINIICEDKHKSPLINIINKSVAILQNSVHNSKYLDHLVSIIDTAIRLSRNDKTDLVNIHQLGEGWVAEETLAIAIYCSLKYQNDFEKAIVTAVNHNGDSDSTGAVTGNILGAYLGHDKIPIKYKQNLEFINIIKTLADDLYTGCKVSENGKLEDKDWIQKYVTIAYKPN